jgi:hypothetical protein
MSLEGVVMPTFIQHNNINIVTLYHADEIAEHCQPGDVVLKQEGDHWMTYEVRSNGQVSAAGFPCESYDKAMEAAKAIAGDPARLK